MMENTSLLLMDDTIPGRGYIESVRTIKAQQR